MSVRLARVLAALMNTAEIKMGAMSVLVKMALKRIQVETVLVSHSDY